MISNACIAAGILAFLLFVIYDINSVKYRSVVLKKAFFVGLLLLTAATAVLVVTEWNTCVVANIRRVVFLALGGIFFLLLLYTLFFALPFEKTYVREEKVPQVYSKGMYALCRHPGVLWFIGLYASLAAAVPSFSVILAGSSFCVCNLLYIMIQDVWTFPNYFIDYHSYKKAVPFLIPTGKSIAECIRTIKRERKHI